jgi:hypothetical protein
VDSLAPLPGPVTTPIQVLGLGCHGTTVFAGTLSTRPVAVKRLMKRFYNAAEREVRYPALHASSG